MKTILIVEDDTHINKIYTEKLLGEGFNVISSKNGKEGLAFLRSRDIHLILLDIMLPGIMNGFELLEIVQKDNELSKIPVVILTNLDSEQDQASKYNVADYLVKSNTGLDELVSIVKRHSS